MFRPPELRRSSPDPEERPCHPEACVRPEFRDELDSERRERLLVELLRPRVVGHRQRDVIDHGEHRTTEAPRCARLLRRRSPRLVRLQATPTGTAGVAARPPLPSTLSSRAASMTWSILFAKTNSRLALTSSGTSSRSARLRSGTMTLFMPARCAART